MRMIITSLTLTLVPQEEELCSVNTFIGADENQKKVYSDKVNKNTGRM